MRRLLNHGLSAGLLFAAFLIVGGCNRTMMGGYPYPPGSNGAGDSYSSNGQRIYFTSASSSGQPITYTGGPGMMIQSPLSCATCHGSEGHGGGVRFMMRSFDVPDITWPVLIAQHTDHQPYTQETLKQAITKGIDPGGNGLAGFLYPGSPGQAWQ